MSVEFGLAFDSGDLGWLHENPSEWFVNDGPPYNSESITRRGDDLLCRGHEEEEDSEFYDRYFDW